jgi:hypothetical protein
MHRSTLYDLHFISQIHKILIGTLFLLGDESITLYSDDKPFCKLEWDAEVCSFGNLVKPHLLKQIVNTRDGDRGWEKVEVIIGRGIGYQDILPQVQDEPVMTK